jgi:NADH-quinone oxidoreductase subunit N
MNPLIFYFPIGTLSGEMLRSLMPVLVLGLGGALTLILSAFAKTEKFTFPAGVFFLTYTILNTTLNLWKPAVVISRGILIFDPYSRSLSLILQILTLCSFYMFSVQRRKEEILPEIFPLALFALLGMILFVSTVHLVFFFIALETLSLAIYVMVSMRRSNPFGAWGDRQRPLPLWGVPGVWGDRIYVSGKYQGDFPTLYTGMPVSSLRTSV